MCPPYLHRSPTIENCVIRLCGVTGEYVAQGGGIYSNGSPVIQNCEISYNSAYILNNLEILTPAHITRFLMETEG
jgi:hypothetical protein